MCNARRIPQRKPLPTKIVPLAVTSSGGTPSAEESLAMDQPLIRFKGRSLSSRFHKAASAAPKKHRRCRTQRPGLTAKKQVRHFVKHNYHDRSKEDVATIPERQRKENSNWFPIKLHRVLDQVKVEGKASVISWRSHGRCFVIHKPREFVATLMPRFFRQSKLTSFQRQLNLYGFQRITQGPDAGGYYHEYFLRSHPNLCIDNMTRTKVKGTRFKAASSPSQEPNLYALPPVDDVAAAAECGETTDEHGEEEEEEEELLEDDSMTTEEAAHSLAPPSSVFARTTSSSAVLNHVVGELFCGSNNAVDSDTEDEEALADFLSTWSCQANESADQGQTLLLQDLERDKTIQSMLDLMLDDE